MRYRAAYMEYVRQCCYDAVAYAHEMTIENKFAAKDRQLGWELAFLEKIAPEITHKELHLTSIKSKLLGVGHDPAKRI